MRCPFCGAAETKVVDSRLSSDTDQIRRRRLCNECQERFTTYETAELNMPRIVKRDRSRQAFDEEKLRRGILRALEKRPISVPDVDRMMSRIKRNILACGERECPSQKLGEWVMDELQSLDQVAYIRFASVYRDFEDVAQFREMIERLEQNTSQDIERRQLSLLTDTRSPDITKEP